MHGINEVALEIGSIGTWGLEIETKKVFFSKIWKKILNYEDEDISNTMDEWEGRIHDSDREFVMHHLSNLIEGLIDKIKIDAKTALINGFYARQ